MNKKYFIKTQKKSVSLLKKYKNYKMIHNKKYFTKYKINGIRICFCINKETLSYI
ncbi:hypothetical protein Dthio_PD1924 [Desulfonatronospira thiodismutans ASO3-1]|uniref:Uncharacterized protein n=1 Tax=Desulfonatronospira thiodismutans ASO3-1 TaxID=555779 RepID=D6SP76_9BACT|nr:hypothetical protein Dthio_PD1924 [Desulfonatronospira thiodismutans ASO3-1]